MQALAPALDRVYEQQAHSVLRQKVRVVLGDAALAQAEASGGSLREQTKVTLALTHTLTLGLSLALTLLLCLPWPQAA